ncbi:MAG: SDR family NAD(P)-dependent oxidoreductase [Anaerolineae bacterium]|nr:SDR family NAD(P)-dependent oxidoreductase [Anaerolineae bacterium]
MTQSPPQVALITGASSGIGYATALAFARQGTHVAAIARRADRLAELERAVNALPPGHGDLLPLAADVTRPDELHRAVQQTLERFGRLDIVVANAGIGHRGSIADADWSDLETLLRTNIDGVLHTIRAAVPAMRPTGGGHIVIVSSVAFNLTAPYAAAYSASKAFVSSLARSMRLELEADHIAVTDVLVGRTHTEFNERRLGAGKRTGQGVPTMSPDRVAEGILDAVRHRRSVIVLRFFDRLIVWANSLFPGIMGRLARRQYQ